MWNVRACVRARRGPYGYAYNRPARLTSQLLSRFFPRFLRDPVPPRVSIAATFLRSLTEELHLCRLTVTNTWFRRVH